jgi:hypothetical protein
MSDKQENNLKLIVQAAQVALSKIEKLSGDLLKNRKELKDDIELFGALYTINQEAHEVLSPIEKYTNND